jgi:Icc-related predicted phosphoesterase
MIVYATADTHGHLPDFPEDAELLLIAGDICPDFIMQKQTATRVVYDEGRQRQADWLKTKFWDWIVQAPCPVIATWGNHDFVGEKSALYERVSRPPFYLLQDTSYTSAEGHRIWGTPWVPGLPRWAFYGRDEALQARAELIPEGLDVLMTHGPPAHAGDFIPTSPKQQSKYGNFTGLNVGDPYLNVAILRARPRVVICGHIHEDRGAHEVDGVPVYNVAAVDERYRLHKQPWTRLYELG